MHHSTQIEKTPLLDTEAILSAAKHNAALGKSLPDRIDLALLLRELNIRSVPINILNPKDCGFHILPLYKNSVRSFPQTT